MDLSNENIIHIKSGNTEYLQFRRLLEYKDNLVHAYGIKSLDYRNHFGNKALASYNTLFKEMNIDISTLVKPTQEHTNNVINVDKKQMMYEPDINLDYLKGVDGILTNKRCHYISYHKCGLYFDFVL